MAKRLVVCCDGTWDRPDERSGNVPTPTNVSKILQAIAPTDHNGMEQKKYYHLGVGTTPGQRFSGGAFGYGVSLAIRETYSFLVQHFEPGDELFFLGFSRGAFTARSTAGFVRKCGILRHENAGMVDEAFAFYRKRGKATHPESERATKFRRAYSHESRIRFIGVWDTVGSLGIPLTGRALINWRCRFHDTELSSWVDSAFQALAIDEKRAPFVPTLWKNTSKGQHVEQVWFTGVHRDVGGGYPDHGLSDITLLWMMDRAHECGLTFVADSSSPSLATRANPDPMATPHNSRTGGYLLVPWWHRRLGKKDADHEYAASTATEQYDLRPKYRPRGLVRYLADDGQILDVGRNRKM